MATLLNCLLLVFLLLLSSSDLVLAKIKLATQELPPYQTLINGEMGGVVFSRVTCALDLMNERYEIHMVAWKDAQLKTEQGEFQGFFAGSLNENRQRYAQASDPVVSDRLSWYTLGKFDFDPNKEENKTKARYGTKFATSKWLNIYSMGYNVVKKPQNAESLLRMLLSGEIDVAYEYELIFENVINKMKINRSRLKRVSHKKNSLRVFFANKFINANPAFLNEFNRKLARCSS